MPTLVEYLNRAATDPSGANEAYNEGYRGASQRANDAASQQLRDYLQGNAQQRSIDRAKQVTADLTSKYKGGKFNVGVSDNGVTIGHADPGLAGLVGREDSRKKFFAGEMRKDFDKEDFVKRSQAIERTLAVAGTNNVYSSPDALASHAVALNPRAAGVILQKYGHSGKFGSAEEMVETLKNWVTSNATNPRAAADMDALREQVFAHIPNLKTSMAEYRKKHAKLSREIDPSGALDSMVDTYHSPLIGALSRLESDKAAYEKSVGGKGAGGGGLEPQVSSRGGATAMGLQPPATAPVTMQQPPVTAPAGGAPPAAKDFSNFGKRR